MRCFQILIFPALAFLCAVFAGAQAPVERRSPEQVPTLKVQSRLVTVAVNVQDAEGNPFTSLTQADFALAEDGKPQSIAFFERASRTPLSIVLAVDASESVLTHERTEMEAAKRFARAVLRPPAAGSVAGSAAAEANSAEPSSPSGPDELDLMEFSDQTRELVSFTSDLHRINDGLGNLHHGDATALYNAVYLASQRLGETSAAGGRRRVLVVISDGDSTVPGVGYDAAVKAAQRAGVAIYPLIVVPIFADAGRDTGGEHALIQMANDTGGRYFYVTEPKEFMAAFNQLTNELKTQYVLGYYAPPPGLNARTDGFRTIHVSLTDQARAGSLHLRYRTGYDASEGRKP